MAMKKYEGLSAIGGILAMLGAVSYDMEGTTVYWKWNAWHPIFWIILPIIVLYCFVVSPFVEESFQNMIVDNIWKPCTGYYWKKKHNPEIDYEVMDDDIFENLH